MKTVLALLLVLLSLPASSQEDPCKALLAKWNWPIESENESMTMSVPKKLVGIPELHYQNASLDVGLDLSKAAGKEVRLRKFVLKERGGESGAKVFAHIALYDGKVVGAWLSTDAPIAPGIVSLRSREFPKNL